MIKLILLLLCVSSAHADTKMIDGIRYGNICRSGNVYSVRFDPIYWAPVGSVCDVLRLDGTVYSKGIIVRG